MNIPDIPYLKAPLSILSAGALISMVVIGFACPDGFFFTYLIVFVCVFGALFIAHLFFLIFKPTALYGPEELGQDNYIKLNTKVQGVENDVQEIQELPMIMYSRLRTLGKRLCLKIFREKSLSTDAFIEEMRERANKIGSEKMIREIYEDIELLKDYGWITETSSEASGSLLEITESGELAIVTFIEFVYARIRPDNLDNLIDEILSKATY